MVKNREELLKVAHSNANQLKRHLRNAVSNFLEAQQVTPDELAYVLGLTDDEMHQILDGDGNITVDALSKLLVATDMAVEIKPVGKTPLGAYGPKMPRGGGFPGPGGIPVDENGNILPPPPGWHPGFAPGFGPAPRVRRREERSADSMREIPMETTGPARDSHGRFVKKSPATHCKAEGTRPHAAPIGNPYLNIGDNELANIIRSNIWDGEIDVNTATHKELADFVANKERIMRERSEAPVAEKREAPKAETAVKGGGNSLNEFLEMLGNVAREAEHNPALMDAIARFMPRK